MVTITPKEKEAVQRGDVSLLLSLLEQADKRVVVKLKKDKTDETRFFQGASHVIDELIKILS